MLRIFAVVFVMLVIYRVLRVRQIRAFKARQDALMLGNHQAPQFFVDPTCGKEVTRRHAHLLWQEGELCGFCSKDCMRAFQHEHAEDWKI